MNNTAKAYLAITSQALITGFSFLALKIALRSAGTFDLLAHRFTLAALSVLIFSFFRHSAKTLLSSCRNVHPMIHYFMVWTFHTVVRVSHSLWSGSG